MRLNKSVQLLLYTILVFFFGTLVAGFLGLYQPTVTINISNQSNQELKSMTINHRCLGMNGTLQVPPLAAGKSIEIPIFVPYDASYSVTTTLTNGTVYKEGGYIEPGYYENIVVKETGICAKSSQFRRYLYIISYLFN